MGVITDKLEEMTEKAKDKKDKLKRRIKSDEGILSRLRRKKE